MIYGDKSLPERLNIKGPKGQTIPNAKINIAYYITKEQFRKMYFDEKMTYQQIIEEIDYPYDKAAFSRVVRNFGWKPTKGKENKFTVNEDFFGKWTAESAWLYGWLLTDGFIDDKSVDLTLQSCDIDVLHKMKSITDFSGDLYKREKHNTLRIYNRFLVAGIRELGFPETDKTFTCAFPELPKEYAWDFIRGVFEGDGSIGTYGGQLSVSICGASEEFMRGINDFLVGEGLKVRFYKAKRDTDFFVIGPNNMKDNLQMLFAMYQSAPRGVRMDRKFNEYMNFLAHFYEKNRKCDESKHLVETAREHFREELANKGAA